MKIANKVAAVGLIIMSYFLLIKPLVINSLLLYNNNALTVGKVVEFEVATNGGPICRLDFYINGKKFNATFNEDARYPNNIGDCYSIEYYPPNPSICKVLTEEKVACKE